MIMILSICLCGCGNRALHRDEQSRKTYENVEAVITDINTKYWFAGTHRYEWSIDVYYEPYDLEFHESSWSTGAFNCPYFFFKQEGDSISVEICNDYINGELVKRHVLKIN